MNIINESIYWHGRGGMSDCLNRLLQGVLDCAPPIILIIFFCKVKNLPTVGRVAPENYSIVHNRKYA
jgi:hypothetical protein